MENKRSKRAETLPVDEVMNKNNETETENTTESISSKSPVKEGIVYNCSKLNVRKEPSKESSILKVISKDTKVKIIDEVNEEWYKVRIPGIKNGFCMKDFIKVVK